MTILRTVRLVRQNAENSIKQLLILANRNYIYCCCRHPQPRSIVTVALHQSVRCTSLTLFVFAHHCHIGGVRKCVGSGKMLPDYKYYPISDNLSNYKIRSLLCLINDATHTHARYVCIPRVKIDPPLIPAHMPQPAFVVNIFCVLLLEANASP